MARCSWGFENGAFSLSLLCSLSLFTHTYMHTNAHKYVHAHTCTPTYACRHIYTHTHARTDTLTHKHKNARSYLFTRCLKHTLPVILHTHCRVGDDGAFCCRQGATHCPYVPVPPEHQLAVQGKGLEWRHLALPDHSWREGKGSSCLSSTGLSPITRAHVSPWYPVSEAFRHC